MRKLIVFALILSFTLGLHAQIAFDKPNFNPNFQLGGFLHPDKVKMNHSMSFMSGMSSRGDGIYQSSYTNHMNFQLKDNLKMRLDTSVVNFGSMTHNNDMKFNSNNDNQNVVVPAFSVEWKPSENSTIYFQYQQMRGYQAPYGRWQPDSDWRR